MADTAEVRRCKNGEQYSGACSLFKINLGENYHIIHKRGVPKIIY